MKTGMKWLIGGLAVVAVGAAINEDRTPTLHDRMVSGDVFLVSSHSYNVETGVDVFTSRPACRVTPVSSHEQDTWKTKTGFTTAGFLGGLQYIQQVEGPRVANPHDAEILCNEGARMTPGRTGTYILE